MRARGLVLLCSAFFCLPSLAPSALADPSYTFVDLNPSGFTESEARGVSGGQQVGYGCGPVTGDQIRALLWSGTAESYVDLHSWVPSGYGRSFAQGIDASGNIVGMA